MSRLNIEVVVGLFVLVGLVSFGYLTIKLGDRSLIGPKTYTLDARFSSVAGLKDGAVVQVAGVNVGKVESIHLDKEGYEALVKLQIAQGVELQEDSIASVRSETLLGGKLVSISPGGAEEILGDGDEITETEPSVSLEELISKYIFESGSD